MLLAPNLGAGVPPVQSTTHRAPLAEGGAVPGVSVGTAQQRR